MNEATPSRLKIIHVFRAPVGGLFRHVIDVAQSQIEQGHSVGVFCDSTTGGVRTNEIFEKLEPRLSLGLHRIPMQRNPHWSDIKILKRLQELCREKQPDVLHGHGSKGGAYARLASLGASKSSPVRAYTPHGGSFNYHPGSFLHKLYMNFERYLSQKTDVFLFESQYIKDKFVSYVGEPNRPVRVVLNGISEDEFSPIECLKKQYDFVFVGELRPIKGINRLLEALVILKNKRNLCPSLLIVGAGPSEAELKRDVVQYGLSNHVSFSAPLPIRFALAMGYIMVVPSLAESLPYVVLEAAAAAQPILATHVGGIPEIFGPLTSELIAPDNASVLAEAMERYLQDSHDVREARSQKLRDFVHSQFNLEKMVDGVLAGYGKAIQMKRL
jgi:glycosyltransferase involved in cell wall biosynthesis